MGFLLKTMLRLDLLETIRAVHAGQRKIPAEVAIELADGSAQDYLTPREIEVLGSVARGNSNKIVAARLSVTEDTVKGHMRNILSKLGDERPYACGDDCGHPRFHLHLMECKSFRWWRSSWPVCLAAWVSIRVSPWEATCKRISRWKTVFRRTAWMPSYKPGTDSCGLAHMRDSPVSMEDVSR